MESFYSSISMEEQKHFRHESHIKLSNIKKIKREVEITKISFLVPVRIEFIEGGVVKSATGQANLLKKEVFFEGFQPEFSDQFYEAMGNLIKINANEYAMNPENVDEIMLDAESKHKEYVNKKEEDVKQD